MQGLFFVYLFILELWCGELFVQVDSGALTQALWDVTSLGPTAYPSNMVFVRDYTIKLLETSFPNMTSTEVNELHL